MKSLSEIKCIGVIGAGTMGSGIASAAALSGFRVLLYDLDIETVNRSIGKITAGYGRLFEKQRIDKTKMELSVNNISGITDIEKFSESDFIIEAAAEDIKLKKELFARIENIVNDDVILATNTSSLSVTAISSALKVNRERMAGMHFFNPANIMKLVEVIKGEFTADEAVKIIIEVSRRMDKIPVVCNDTPAFIVNRVARAFYGEALKLMAEESLNAVTIDTIMKDEGGFAMGPFELMDLIGIDVNYSVTKSVYEAFFFDQKYKPSPIQQKMTDAGLLGRKTGQGFYKY